MAAVTQRMTCPECGMQRVAYRRVKARPHRGIKAGVLLDVHRHRNGDLCGPVRRDDAEEEHTSMSEPAEDDGLPRCDECLRPIGDRHACAETAGEDDGDGWAGEYEDGDEP